MMVKVKGEEYLPYPSNIKPDNPNEAEARYNNFIDRAVFGAYTKRTHDGLLGAAFRIAPVAVVSDPMEDVMMDATGTGLSADQLAKACTSSTMKTGRSGLYVSYPMQTEESPSQDVTDLQDPTITLYDAIDIINWRNDNSLIVLREEVDASENEFDSTTCYQYRILRLREQGATSQVIFDDGEETEEVDLIKGDGSRFSGLEPQITTTKLTTRYSSQSQKLTLLTITTRQTLKKTRTSTGKRRLCLLLILKVKSLLVPTRKVSTWVQALPTTLVKMARCS
jgi:hypothetical protein